MRDRRRSSRGISPLALFAVGLLFLLTGGGAVFGALVGLGYIDLWPEPPQVVKTKSPPDYTGMVKVPIARQAVLAYSVVSRDDVAEPDGQIHFIPFRPEEVRPEWIVDLGQIYGRVLARDKTKGLVFTEADFMPRGTRPGLVAGIPPGKRAMVVGAEMVQGLHLLRRGDRFDLMATVPLDMARLVPRVQWGLLTNDIAGRETTVGNLQKQASVRVLVQNGALVNHGSDGKDATIAVEPGEITPLTEAMALGVGIFCVARSGHPEDPGQFSVTPEHNPLSNVAFVENIRGTHRDLEVFITSDTDTVRGFAVPGETARGNPASEDGPQPPGETGRAMPAGDELLPPPDRQTGSAASASVTDRLSHRVVRPPHP